jgi:hypothetical protein
MSSIEIKLKPFMTPNFAIQESPPGLRQDGFEPAPSIPLALLTAEALSEMCDEFRKEVFAKARKIDPATLIQTRTAWEPAKFTKTATRL